MPRSGLWRGIYALLAMIGLSIALTAPARAQNDQAIYQARADEVVVMLNGGGDHAVRPDPRGGASRR